MSTEPSVTRAELVEDLRTLIGLWEARDRELSQTDPQDRGMSIAYTACAESLNALLDQHVTQEPEAPRVEPGADAGTPLDTAWAPWRKGATAPLARLEEIRKWLDGAWPGSFSEGALVTWLMCDIGWCLAALRQAAPRVERRFVAHMENVVQQAVGMVAADGSKASAGVRWIMDQLVGSLPRVERRSGIERRGIDWRFDKNQVGGRRTRGRDRRSPSAEGGEATDSRGSPGRRPLGAGASANESVGAPAIGQQHEDEEDVSDVLVAFRAEVIEACARAEGFDNWRHTDWSVAPVDLAAWESRLRSALRSTTPEETR